MSEECGWSSPGTDQAYDLNHMCAHGCSISHTCAYHQTETRTPCLTDKFGNHSCKHSNRRRRCPPHHYIRNHIYRLHIYPPRHTLCHAHCWFLCSTHPSDSLHQSNSVSPSGHHCRRCIANMYQRTSQRSASTRSPGASSRCRRRNEHFTQNE